MPKQFLINGAKSIPLDALGSDMFTDLIRGESSAPATPQAMYATVAYLYRCVDVRANSLTAVPWSIYRGDTEVVTNDADAWPQELAWCAGIEDLLWQTEAALCMNSKAYWHKLRSRARLLSLRWLDPSTMAPAWTSQGIAGFERTLSGGKKDTLPVDDVVYVRLFGLSETDARPAPVQAALSAAGVLANTDSFVAGYFQRGAIKATLLTVEGNPSPAERERLKSWWRRAFSGVMKAWSAEVISAAVTPVVIGEGISELTNVDLTTSRREDIATALGVPHSLVMSNAANYATAEADRLSFYDTTIVPECNLISRQVNAQLFAPQGYRFEFRPEQMSIYQADENARATAYAAYVGAGLKPSVTAQMLGLHLPEGVQYADLDPVAEAAPQGDTASVDATKSDKPILGYHIESGVVTRNEARASVGLPPVDDSGDKLLRDLNAKLDVMVKAKAAGIAPQSAAQLVGLDVQIDEPTPPQPEPMQPDMMQEDTTDGEVQTQDQGQVGQEVTPAAKSDEVRKFLKWAKGKKTPDPAKFASDILTLEERTNLLLVGAESEGPDVSTRDAYLAAKALILQHDPGDDSTPEEQLLLGIEDTSQREIASALRKQFKDLLPANAENMTLDELQQYLDKRLSNQAVNDAIDRAVRRAADAGVNIAIDQLGTLGVGFDFTAVNTAARDWARQYSGELIKGINDTTRQAVRESVARWYENGEHMDALTQDLAPTFGPKRARLIAATETTRSSAEAARQGYVASGVVTAMLWLTASDELVCPVCGELNGKVVSLDGSFSDVLPPELQKAGKAFRAPPAHPNCRCRLGAKVIGAPNE